MSKRVMIDLPLAFGFKKPFWRVVRAEIVDVGAHLWPATFAVDHRSRGDWAINNIETGAFVTSGNTREAAIRRAKTVLSSVTQEMMRREFRKARRVIRDDA
jgi:hypothetical protein